MTTWRVLIRQAPTKGTGLGARLPVNLNVPDLRQRRLSLVRIVRYWPTCPQGAYFHHGGISPPFNCASSYSHCGIKPVVVPMHCTTNGVLIREKNPLMNSTWKSKLTKMDRRPVGRRASFGPKNARTHFDISSRTGSPLYH